jgi:hypothetical protein
MRKFEEGRKYLCTLGIPRCKNNDTFNVRVGVWNGYAFEFSNGAYSNTRLFWHTQKKDNSGNATRVLKARKV